jgi:hypothetical protein
MKIDKCGEMLRRTINPLTGCRIKRLKMAGRKKAHKKSFAGLQQLSRKALFPSGQENRTGGPFNALRPSVPHPNPKAALQIPLSATIDCYLSAMTRLR